MFGLYLWQRGEEEGIEKPDRQTETVTSVSGSRVTEGENERQQGMERELLFHFHLSASH